MKRKPIVIIFVAFVFLIALRLGWLFMHSPPEQPQMKDAVLDLTTYELPHNQSIILNGEWGFVPNALDLNQPYTDFVAVPGSDTIQENTNFGTYQATIKLPNDIDESSRWAIKLPTIHTAYALYINKELVGASGHIAMHKEQHEGKGFSKTTYFSTDQPVIDITLLVSNFDTKKGVGLTKSIHFGNAEAVYAEHALNQTLTISLVVVLSLFSVFSVLVYFFIYKNKIVLFFTLGFLLPAIDELTTFNRALLDYLPLNYEWSTKFLNLVYLGAAFFFIQFMRLLLVHYREVKLFNYYSWLYLVCALLIIILPVSTLTEADTSFFVLYALSFLSVVVLALREFISDKKTSIFLALTALCTTSGITWGAIKGMLSLDIPFYPFDYLFGLICFAAFWFKHFYQLKVESDRLVVKLQEINKQRDSFLEESTEKLWGPLNEMITIGQTVYDTEQNMALASKQNIKYFIDIGRGMSFTLNDLLIFTQLKGSDFVLKQKNVHAQTLVPGIFDLLAFMTSEEHIQLTSLIPEDFPAVFADEDRLIQVLFNTLHNAVKYTPIGNVTIRASKNDGFAQFEVQDTGIGMEQEALPEVLEPFVQLEDCDKGIGIGLTVSRQLVLLHGGTFAISSTPNEGTTIRFSFPLGEEIDIPVKQKMDSSQSLLGKAMPYKPSAKPFSILVIDDDPVSLFVIRNIFASAESDVVTTRHVKDALRLIEKSKWDLIIIDAMMPVESGYSLTKLIREKFTKLELPILLLTARNYPIDVYAALAFGANDYVTKPINSLELKTRGHALIDLKKSIDDRFQMESTLLQAQIKPHFLFNTLNSISALSMTDPERMILLLNHFGKYLQSSFDTENLNPTIPIQKEIELVEAYLYIQRERFQNRLRVTWEVPQNLSFDIPPIILQTLVENAIRHGVLKKPKGGEILIKIEEKTSHFFIQIADDGVGIPKDVLHTLKQNATHSTKGIGIHNSNLRLLEVFNEELHIDSETGVGTTVSFKIPK